MNEYDVVKLNALDEENAALKAELAAAKKDAERYRWLRRHLLIVDLDGKEPSDDDNARFDAAMEAQCTHEYEIDSDHPNHSCCQNCGEILKDGVHVQPVAQARSRAGMLAAAEMERSKGK